MASELKGKIIAITGASSGIGEVMAREFANAGAVPVLLARSIDKLEAIAKTLPGKQAFYRMDVRSDEQVTETVRQIAETFGRIDVWINNAGYGVFEKLQDASMDTLQDMMDVNYLGTARCTKAVLPFMLSAGAGHIVNVASMAGKIGTPKATAYSATKHAVLGFTNSLRMELAGTGIQVTAVNPGPIATSFFDRADPTGAYVANVKAFMLKPERVARAIVDAVRTGKAEVNLPYSAAFGVKLLQLFPGLLGGIALRMLSKK
jgi:short-subunit dehydrogenase